MPYFNSEQRHYKKDTRFLLDLYTITYDNHESVDNVCCLVSFFILFLHSSTIYNWHKGLFRTLEMSMKMERHLSLPYMSKRKMTAPSIKIFFVDFSLLQRAS